jgi:hypothetical protein
VPKVLEKISDLPGVLFDFLWEMEKEADLKVRKRDGEFRTGLISYAWYVEELQKRKGIRTKKPARNTPWEKSWQSRLLELFRESGVTAEEEEDYPNGQQVDLKLTLPDHSIVFLEIKGAWTYKTYKRPVKNDTYPANLTSITKGAAGDFLKLADAKADYVAVLVLGFDIPETEFVITKKDIDKMKEKAKFHDHKWEERVKEWDGQDIPSIRTRVHCCLWYRAQATP